MIFRDLGRLKGRRYYGEVLGAKFKNRLGSRTGIILSINGLERAHSSISREIWFEWREGWLSEIAQGLKFQVRGKTAGLLLTEQTSKPTYQQLHMRNLFNMHTHTHTWVAPSYLRPTEMRIFLQKIDVFPWWFRRKAEKPMPEKLIKSTLELNLQ